MNFEETAVAILDAYINKTILRLYKCILFDGFTFKEKVLSKYLFLDQINCLFGITLVQGVYYKIFRTL